MYALHSYSVMSGQDVLTTDFCYGYLSFSPSGVALSLPGGFGLDLLRYWDGQPIYFVCCERAGPQTGPEAGQPLGKVFWCVAVEVLDGEEEDADGEDGEDEDEALQENTEADVDDGVD